MPKKNSRKQVPEMDVISDDSSSDEEMADGGSESSDEADKESAVIEDPTIAALNSLTKLLDEPQNLLHTLLIPPSSRSQNDDDDDGSSGCSFSCQIQSLRSTSKSLFSRLEKLAHMLEDVENKQKGIANDDGENQEEQYPLSGLEELLVGSLGNEDDDDDGVNIDMGAETIWGQVDIQNTALISKANKTIRKLSKVADQKSSNEDDGIRILDMQDIISGDEGGMSEAEDDSSEAENDSSDDEGPEEEDEEARRIRERMERSMAEMDDSDQDTNASDSDDAEDAEDRTKGKKEEDAIDPARESLNDGFFDLHEMEDFADEEEDMLPIEAWGESEANVEEAMEEKRKNLPHIRGRAGEDDDEDDQEFDALEKRVETTSNRKKYRDDQDINALATLYDEAEEDDSDDDFVNMSATEFFGQPRKPSKEYAEKLRKENEKKVESKDPDADEADSWDDHDFGTNGTDWREKSGGESSDDEQDKEDMIDSDHEEGDDDDQETVDGDNKNIEKESNHAVRSKKLQEQTEDFEKEMLAEKPWQMLGEATATKRPENSLLEVTPEFEFATKMAPIITQEHTVSIEEMIKQRILAEDWDDVIPRELPDIGLDKRNGELPEVSQEKSKLSLGELYEREYLKKATGYDKDAVEKETEEEKVKNEMKMLFANLCSKLDALSNYHFAPRPVSDEADVKTASTPAIAREEVLPLHVSDAKAMAPEEIFNKKKGRDGILRGESEMDQTDRKRLRQSKKTARRKARKAKLADEKLISRLKPELGLNNPYEKRKMREELQMARASGRVVQGEVESNADFKTSAKFFQKMQSDVQQLLHNEDGAADKKRKRDGEGSAKSSKFKL